MLCFWQKMGLDPCHKQVMVRLLLDWELEMQVRGVSFWSAAALVDRKKTSEVCCSVLCCFVRQSLRKCQGEAFCMSESLVRHVLPRVCGMTEKWTRLLGAVPSMVMETWSSFWQSFLPNMPKQGGLLGWVKLVGLSCVVAAAMSSWQKIWCTKLLCVSTSMVVEVWCKQIFQFFSN